MPFYEVTLKEIETYVITKIEADDEFEAIEKGWELLFESEENKAKYYNDSDEQSEAVKIT